MRTSPRPLMKYTAPSESIEGSLGPGQVGVRPEELAAAPTSAVNVRCAEPKTMLPLLTQLIWRNAPDLSPEARAGGQPFANGSVAGHYSCAHRKLEEFRVPKSAHMPASRVCGLWLWGGAPGLPDLRAVLASHAGRGPCFGPRREPGPEWQKGREGGLVSKNPPAAPAPARTKPRRRSL